MILVSCTLLYIVVILHYLILAVSANVNNGSFDPVFWFVTGMLLTPTWRLFQFWILSFEAKRTISRYVLHWNVITNSDNIHRPANEPTSEKIQIKKQQKTFFKGVSWAEPRFWVGSNAAANVKELQYKQSKSSMGIFTQWRRSSWILGSLETSRI